MRSAASIAILVSARRIANRERLFLRVADLLTRRRCTVTFLAASPEHALRSVLHASYDLVDISPLPPSSLGVTVPHGLRMASSVPKLASYLRRAKPDVLFATSVPPNLVAATAASTTGFRGRLVLRQSNAVHVAGAAALADVDSHWRDRLIPRLYRRADAIIANSAGVARNLVELGLDTNGIVAIPNGVECDWVDEASRDALRLAVPDSGSGPLIVTAGRLVPQKDHATLVRAFACLQVLLPSRLVILGDGPERARLESLARNLGVHDRILFPGYLDNPFPLFSRADLFVLSSRYEGMPNVLLEALACGLPVVSTDCPHGPAEILKDGWFGSLVPIGDHRRLAQEMMRSLRAPRNPERQRARARQFDEARIAQLYVDALLRSQQPSTLRQAAE